MLGRRPVPDEKPDCRGGGHAAQRHQPRIMSDADRGKQRQAEADRGRLAAGEPVDAVHEIEQVDEPDPEQHRGNGIEPGRQPALKYRTRERAGRQHEGDRGELRREPHGRR